ncbi:AAA family ATPase [Lunatibacter salilacus]|uniref:AAA family ATPase n=1 Tax=Lunatibacter salilacus TaxID=2483804 RepID=UPI00131D5BD0|nr:AAA family ATPase [Lunatibacter salilacus]
MNIYAVGSSFGGTKDVSKEFFEEGIWYDGHAERGDMKYINVLKVINVGDLLVMKSSATKGKNHKISFTKVKAIGQIKSKIDTHKFSINWWNLEGLPIEFDGIWYSQTVEKVRDDDLRKFVLKQVEKMKVHEVISLLKFKSQIILQGPPGTGKTWLAKKLANSLCQSQELTADYIKNIFQPGMKIESSSSKKEYIIVAVKENAINLKLETGTNYDIPYHGIIQAFESMLWKGGLKNNQDSYRAALAKYIFEHMESGEYKLLQFHPAYSYDDFVRGIMADTSNGILNYKSIDKVFAEFAHKAWENYHDSRKSPEQISREQEVEKYLELFRDYLEDEIESKNGKLVLEGTIIYLFQVEEDAVRYTGDNWKLVSGQRLLFSDIKTLFLEEATSRQDIKANSNVSGLAKQHASYFLRVLNLFKDFVKKKEISFIGTKPVTEKNYVLIIDEINRANLPSVLGELIYGLEYRGEPVESMYAADGSRSIVVPPNLFVIGTMNTADRSVGHIDYAIRRRFAFVEVLPSVEPIKNEEAKVYFEKVSKLFVSNYYEVILSNAAPKNAECLMSDFKPEEVWIGHSYFLTENEGEIGDLEIRTKMKFEVLPLLKEYVKDGILKTQEERADDPVQLVINELSGL